MISFTPVLMGMCKLCSVQHVSKSNFCTHYGCSYIGFSLSRQSGFWQSTVLSLFIGVVVVIIAVYTRQRTVGLLPAMKAAQD